MRQFEIGGFSRRNRLASLGGIYAHPLPAYHPDYGMQERIREALEEGNVGEHKCAISDRVIREEIVEEIWEHYKAQGRTAERVFDALEAFLDWDRMIVAWRDTKYFLLTFEDGTKWWVPRGDSDSF